MIELIEKVDNSAYRINGIHNSVTINPKEKIAFKGA